MLLVKEYYSRVNSFYIVEKSAIFYSKVINVVRWKSNMYLDHTSDKDLL